MTKERRHPHTGPGDWLRRKKRGLTRLRPHWVQGRVSHFRLETGYLYADEPCVNVAFIDWYSPSHLIGLDWCRADLIEDSNVPYSFTLRLVQLIAQSALVGIAFGGDQELLSAASPIRPVQSIRYSCDFEGKHLIVFRCTGATLADRPSPSHLIRLDWCHADLIEDSNVPYPFTLRPVQWRAVRVSLVFPRSC